MAGRVARRELDHNRAVSEHVVVFVMHDNRLGILEFAVVGWLRLPRSRLGKHGIAFGFLHDPRRGRELIGICRMVGMIVRHGEVGNVGRFVAYSRQLRQQFPGRGEYALFGGPSICRKVCVWNLPDIPHQRASRMHDQIAGRDEIQ